MPNLFIAAAFGLITQTTIALLYVFWKGFSPRQRFIPPIVAIAAFFLLYHGIGITATAVDWVFALLAFPHAIALIFLIGRAVIHWVLQGKS